MFVITVKSKFKTKKSKIMLLCTCLMIFVLVVFVMVSVVPVVKDKAYCQSIGEYSLNAESESEVEGFAQQFSLEIDELYSEKIVRIPLEFNNTYNKYNELQKKHGLDLSNYKGKECMLRIYSLEDDKRYLFLVIYKGRVIGGHLSECVDTSAMYSFSGE